MNKEERDKTKEHKFVDIICRSVRRKDNKTPETKCDMELCLCHGLVMIMVSS